MKLTSDLIYGFTNSLLVQRFDNPRPTPQFHLTLWDIMCSEHPKVAVAAPRNHAKSTAVTHAYVLANICFKVKKHILLVSDTEGQAVNFLNDIKNELTENEDLISLFEIRKLVKDTATEIIVEFKDGVQCRVIVKGSEQKVRGLKWRNTRPDLIVCDDLENDEIVLNEDRRYKFMRWFYGALLPCGSDDSIIRVVGTILHMDSLLENLMPSATDQNTVTEDLVQYSTNADEPWLARRYKAHNEDFTAILWPERFNKEYFVRIRNDFIKRGFPEGYSQEYLNYPLDEENAYFKLKDFIPVKEWYGTEEFYVACDFAISEKDTRAYTAMSVAAVDHIGKLKFKEVARFRGDSLAIIDEMFRLNNIYKPECFFVEQENIARSLGPVITREMQERNQYFNIVPMIASKDKIRRARALQARMRAGMVEFDTESSWFPQFQEELLQFPRGKYADQVDSAAWIALGLESIVDAPTKREAEEERYEEELEDTYYYDDYGRSSVTGY